MSEVRPKWPERLVIVRHGEAEHNVALDLFEKEREVLTTTRNADIELTPRGIWQAEQTGRCLAKTPQFDICFSSPYERALHTAGIITCDFLYDIRIFRDDRLREKDFGKLHGLSMASIKERYPDEYAAREGEGKFYYRLPGGENYPDVGMRVHSFMDKLTRDWGGKHVLVSTHQVPSLMFRHWFEYLDEEGILALGDVPNCGMMTYVLDRSEVPEGRMRLESFNKISYDMAEAPSSV